MIQVKRSVRYLCCLTRLFILRCSGGSNGYLNLLKRNNIRRNSIKTVPPFLYIICKRKTALIMIIKAVGTPRGIRTPDPLVRSQILYPTELLPRQNCRSRILANPKKKGKAFCENTANVVSVPFLFSRFACGTVFSGGHEKRPPKRMLQGP